MSTNRVLSILILLVGVALLIAPVGYKMFDRAPAGADMMKDFEPVLTRPNVTTFQGHMQTFGGMQADMNKMMPAFAQPMGVIGCANAGIILFMSACMPPKVCMCPWKVVTFGRVR